MFHIALFEPEIPPNTGNIIRLCANTGSTLHLIHPLGFQMEDKLLRRAGLDYSEFAVVQHHVDYAHFLQHLPGQRIFACSTKGTQRYDQCRFQAQDVLLFGPESRGLPRAIRESLPPQQVITIPMQASSRSLNLANSVAILVYEAWRQQDFNCGP